MTPTRRIVTPEQLNDGFLIRWPDGRIQRASYCVTRGMPDGNIEVKEPTVSGRFVFDAGRFRSDDQGTEATDGPR